MASPQGFERPFGFSWLNRVLPQFVAKSLMDLMKKGAFIWMDEVQQASERLKNAMDELPILAISDIS